VTNFEKIKQMSVEEFADYIQAVFIAGKLSKTDSNLVYENYKEWLESTADANN